MGCCFSCNEEGDTSSQDNNDRSQLLRDPVSNSTPVVVPHSDPHAVGNSLEGACSKGQEDELAKILQETAAAMIDVSGSTSHSLDQREYLDRTRQYHQKIHGLQSDLIRRRTVKLNDTPNPEKQLSGPLISEEDIQLMNWAMNEVKEGLNSIKIHNDEVLVVPFGGQQLSMVPNEC